MTDEECQISPRVKECIDADSLGFWIPCCGFWIADSTSKNFPDFLTWGTKMVYTVQLFESSTYLIKQAKNENITRDVAQK